MNRFLIILMTLLTLMITNQLYAHGEDKAGPHNGFVRMPGNYHTELVLENKNSVRVYLLDIEWKNPKVTNSTLQLSHKAKKVTPSNCIAQESSYLCSFPVRIDLTKKAQLIVKSQRDGQSGSTVTYNLPLKLEPSAGEHH